MGCGGSKEEVENGKTTVAIKELEKKRSRSSQTSTKVCEIDVKEIDEKRASNESMDQYFSPIRDDVFKAHEEDDHEKVNKL